MQACHYISKGGQNSFHGYSYVTSADVLEKVNTAMADVGLVSTVMPSMIDFREVPNAKGNIEKHATVQVEVTIHDTDSGESITFGGIGSGQDSGDKAIMKAETAAIKYAYMLSLCIATGDDPEADRRTDEHTSAFIADDAFRESGNTVKTKPSTNRTSSSTVNTSTNNTIYNQPIHREGFNCNDCGSALTSKVHTYSINKYGIPLCMNCQKNHRQIA